MRNLKKNLTKLNILFMRYVNKYIHNLIFYSVDKFIYVLQIDS